MWAGRTAFEAITTSSSSHSHTSREISHSVNTHGEQNNTGVQKKSTSKNHSICAAYRIFSHSKKKKKKKKKELQRKISKNKTPRPPPPIVPKAGMKKNPPSPSQSFQVIRIMVVFVFPHYPFLLASELLHPRRSRRIGYRREASRHPFPAFPKVSASLLLQTILAVLFYPS